LYKRPEYFRRPYSASEPYALAYPAPVYQAPAYKQPQYYSKKEYSTEYDYYNAITFKNLNVSIHCGVLPSTNDELYGILDENTGSVDISPFRKYPWIVIIVDDYNVSLLEETSIVVVFYVYRSRLCFLTNSIILSFVSELCVLRSPRTVQLCIDSCILYPRPSPEISIATWRLGLEI